MDQSIVAGIGNVYSDEILFQAGVHPGTRVSELDETRVEDIFDKMKKVLRTAVDRDADPGRFPSTYLLPNRGKKGACPLCGTKWETMKLGGRTAYFCPRCQEED
jgi:formamidopyrimidine-DNA glycosylase